MTEGNNKNNDYTRKSAVHEKYLEHCNIEYSP